MIELLKLKYFYLISFIFIIIFALSVNKIRADQEVKILADKIIINDKNQTIEALGNAIAIDQDGNELKSDKILLDDANSNIFAEENVVLNDIEGNTFFMKELLANDGINTIQGTNVKARLKDNSRIVGSKITKKENITILSDAEYTPCEQQNYLIPNCPGWKLKSNKIYRNSESKTIHYDHARIHLFNIPLFYLPYFSHPDPSVNKKSGLLMPTVETDDKLGDKFSLPIFYNIADNQDITLTPNYQSKSNNFYTLNYRYLDNNGRYNIEASIDDNDDNSGTSNHFFFDADINNPFGDLSGFLQNTNNDTYMRKNKINKLTVLKSGLNFEKSNDDTYFSLSAIGYKHLAIQNGEQWEYEYPKINYNINNIEESITGGDISLNNQFHFNKGLDDSYTSLASSQINWYNTDVNYDNGLLFENGANFRIVSISNDNKNASDTNNIRFYPQIHSVIKYPLIKYSKNSSQSLTPIFMPILAPYNNYTSAQVINSSNLFSSNRASSINEWESGPRINYGVDWFIENNEALNLKFTLGQSYRFNKSKSDTTKELSDYYFTSNLSLNDNYINNSIVLDRNDIDVKSINLNTFTRLDKLKLAMDYDYTSGKYTSPKEQIGIGGKYNFARDFYFKFTGSKNLDTNKNIGYQYGFLYENDCLGIDFNFFRDLTVDRDISESDGFSFTIVLKPFGSTQNYGVKKVFGPSIND